MFFVVFVVEYVVVIVVLRSLYIFIEREKRSVEEKKEFIERYFDSHLDWDEFIKSQNDVAPYTARVAYPGLTFHAPSGAGGPSMARSTGSS